MKILYAAAGEGMGHAIRSETIINQFSKNTDILFVGGGKAYQHLRNKVKAHKINCLNIVYEKNKVAGFKTFLKSISTIPKLIKEIFKVRKIIKKYKPNVIISDFEPVSIYAGILTGTKVITLDNQHIISNTKIKYPTKYWLSAFTSKTVIKMIAPWSNANIITTFFHPKIKKKNTFFIGPVVRNKIKRIKPKEKDYFLVYQTSDSNTKLLKKLQKTNKKFIVYGFHKNKQFKNVILKKNNETEFFDDLKNCKGVIINGGFTLMSEALYLKKPIMSIPVREQFEQILNAVYLQKKGYGVFVENFSEKAFLGFENNISDFKQNLKKNPVNFKTNQIKYVVDRILK